MENQLKMQAQSSAGRNTKLALKKHKRVNTFCCNKQQLPDFSKSYVQEGGQKA